MKRKHLESGWADDSYSHSPYHFTHYPLEKARQEQELAESWVWVIETINWTHAQGDARTVHKNAYYEVGLDRAIGLAALIALASKDVTEQVINIRPATPDEKLEWLRVYEIQDKLKRPDLASVIEKTRKPKH